MPETRYIAACVMIFPAFDELLRAFPDQHVCCNALPNIRRQGFIEFPVESDRSPGQLQSITKIRKRLYAAPEFPQEQGIVSKPDSEQNERAAIIGNFDEIVEYSFGLSIYSFFMNIESDYTICLKEHKEIFLKMLGYLLNEKKIMLTAPGADVIRTPRHIPKFTIYDKEAQWDIRPEDAVQYFRDRWPENLTDSNDVELIYFLYEMPAIIWIADDGSLHAS
jgi:hypothetical protein